MNYLSMPRKDLENELIAIRAEYEEYKNKGYALDISRGKPSAAQLDLSVDILDMLATADDCKSKSGFDCRNYGGLDGLPEMKDFFSAITGVASENIIVGGNSSLTMMYDTMARCMLYGTSSSARPWCREEKVKFLCPAPGYDRHFKICESLGIEMINVKMTPTGPDMDEVERLCAADDSVRGIWCVPKYSNPTGVTFSDETVTRLAKMNCAAPDFRIFWDNAYVIHDLYDEGDELLDIFAEAKKYGNEDRIFYFTSTSKVTFPGSGVAMMAMSEANRKFTLPILSTQSIGPDKLNQLRHVRLFPNLNVLRAHMTRQADHLRARFECLLSVMDEKLAPCGIAEWTKPRGGYFVSLDIMPGCARRAYELAREAGVTLTDVGATYPYGMDRADSNLRLAPSFAPLDEVLPAANILCLCVRIAAAEKLLAE